MHQHTNFRQFNASEQDVPIRLLTRSSDEVLSRDVARKSVITVTGYAFEGVRIPIFDSTFRPLSLGISNIASPASMRTVDFPERFYYSLRDVTERIQLALNAEAVENSTDAPIASWIVDGDNSARLKIEFTSGFLATKQLTLNAGFQSYLTTFPMTATGVVVPTGTEAVQAVSYIERLNPMKRALLVSTSLDVRGEIDAFDPALGFTTNNSTFLADYQFKPIVDGENASLEYVAGRDGSERFHDLLGSVKNYDLSMILEMRTGEKFPGNISSGGYGFVNIEYKREVRAVELRPT